VRADSQRASTQGEVDACLDGEAVVTQGQALKRTHETQGVIQVVTGTEKPLCHLRK